MGLVQILQMFWHKLQHLAETIGVDLTNVLVFNYAPVLFGLLRTYSSPKEHFLHPELKSRLN